MTKDKRLMIALTEQDKEMYERYAVRDTEGNVSLWLRTAAREYMDRHPLEQPVCTEYELQAQ